MKKLELALVDDELELLDLYADDLKNTYSITQFSTPHHFLEHLKSQHYQPDLVVTDYTMPKMTGLDMLREAREYNKEFIPILISGYLNKENAIQAASLGVNHIIEKPLHFDQLAESVHRAAEVYSARQNEKKISEQMTKLKELFDVYRILCEDQFEKYKISTEDTQFQSAKAENLELIERTINQVEKELKFLVNNKIY